MAKRIAFVVQRYGLEINGGSELHCRQVAERLTDRYDVTVLTSCAVEYETWKNEYPAGESEINGVRVLRFPVDKPRKKRTFAKATERAQQDRQDYELGLAWQREQGPHCPGLLQHLSVHKVEYNAVVFMTYLYSPTFFGLHIAPEKSLLIPTAHDEPPIYLNVFNAEFHLPKYFIYNTVTEKNFINNRFRNGHIPSCIAGVGIEVDENAPDIDVSRRFGIEGEYIVYVGRIDENKGCRQMYDYFARYKGETGSGVKLVLAGKSTLELPAHPDVLQLGFVSDEEKVSLIRHARLLMLPSLYESLSMSTLEAMYLETPVLVNGNCDVLKQHCIASGGGLYYHNYDEFAPELTRLLADDALCKSLAAKGREYVEQNYRWDAIIEKIRTAIEYVDGL